MLATALVLAIAGCSIPPESSTALGEPGQAHYDGRLIGNWFWTPDPRSYGTPQVQMAVHLQVLRARSPGLLHIVFNVHIEREETQKGTPKQNSFGLRATAFASELDGAAYYNIQRIAGAASDYTDEGERPGFIIARTEFDEDGRLILRFMHGVNFIEKLVSSGRLKGHMADCRTPFDGETLRNCYPVIDISREALIEFIHSLPDGLLFGDRIGPFRRLPGLH